MCRNFSRRPLSVSGSILKHLCSAHALAGAGALTLMLTAGLAALQLAAGGAVQGAVATTQPAMVEIDGSKLSADKQYPKANMILRYRPWTNVDYHGDLVVENYRIHDVTNQKGIDINLTSFDRPSPVAGDPMTYKSVTIRNCEIYNVSRNEIGWKAGLHTDFIRICGGGNAQPIETDLLLENINIHNGESLPLLIQEGKYNTITLRNVRIADTKNGGAQIGFINQGYANKIIVENSPGLRVHLMGRPGTIKECIVRNSPGADIRDDNTKNGRSGVAMRFETGPTTQPAPAPSRAVAVAPTTQPTTKPAMVDIDGSKLPADKQYPKANMILRYRPWTKADYHGDLVVENYRIHDLTNQKGIDINLTSFDRPSPVPGEPMTYKSVTIRNCEIYNVSRNEIGWKAGLHTDFIRICGGGDAQPIETDLLLENINIHNGESLPLLIQEGKYNTITLRNVRIADTKNGGAQIGFINQGYANKIIVENSPGLRVHLMGRPGTIKECIVRNSPGADIRDDNTKNGRSGVAVRFEKLPTTLPASASSDSAASTDSTASAAK